MVWTFFCIVLQLVHLSACGRFEATFYTGDNLLAGTNANVYIQLFGKQGLPNPPIKINSGILDMRPGSIDSYEFSVAKLSGDIPLIKVWHDNILINPSWFLKKVEIREISQGRKLRVMTFPVYKWLAEKRIDIKLPWPRDGEETARVVYAQQKYRDECGRNSVGKARVVNGNTASLSQFPWQAQIKIPFTYRPHSCGGTLIHPQYVLTAAHCVTMMKDPDSYIVTLGEYNLKRRDGTEQIRNVSKLIPHPEYDRTKDLNDIAIMKLSRPVLINRSVKPACLPENERKDIKPGTRCLLSGWGRTTESDNNPPDILQYTYMNVISQEKCSKDMKDLGGVIKETMFCAGQKNTSGCHGDSGGPLVCLKSMDKRFYIQGLVSWGSPTCEISDNRHSVFTRVTQYIQWIESHIYSQYGKFKK